MAVVIALIVLALILGGVGLAVKGLLWLLIIAGILILVGGLLGFRSRGSSV